MLTKSQKFLFSNLSKIKDSLSLQQKRTVEFAAEKLVLLSPVELQHFFNELQKQSEQITIKTGLIRYSKIQDLMLNDRSLISKSSGICY